MIYKTLWIPSHDRGADDKIENLAKNGWRIHTFVVEDGRFVILFERERP